MPACLQKATLRANIDPFPARAASFLAVGGAALFASARRRVWRAWKKARDP